MSVTDDCAAVERRIAGIAGRSPQVAGPPQSAPAFGAQVAVATERIIRAAAATAGVDPALVGAVARTESSLNPAATSSAGAAGLMQLMPATAQALGVTDPYDPAQNVRGGAAYLRQLLERFDGNVPRAVAAYNAGPRAVERYGGIPPYAETQRYVARVMDAYGELRRRR